MAIEIVEYDPTLKPGILEVERYLWGPDLAVNAANFEWKYERNPYLNTQFVRVALADGVVVGMRGIWGSRWEAGDPPASFVVPCAGDLVVAPEHRRRGLSVELIQAPISDLRSAGYRYVFNLSPSPATQIGSLRSGWRRAGVLETARRGHSRRPLTQRLRARLRRGRLARKVADRIDLIQQAPKRSPGSSFEALDRRPTSSADRVVCERAARPEAMAELVERIGHDGRLRHVRDLAYFAWRFDSPMHAYRFLFYEDGRLDGYLVLESGGRPSRPGINIVDWEATTPEVRAELLQAAVSWGRFRELATWSVTLPGETLRLLEEAGFAFGRAPASIGSAYRTGGRRTPLLVRALGEDDAEWSIGGRGLLGLEGWDLRMLYSDNF
jgi:GNAT superfamily N-acetyltransferase